MTANTIDVRRPVGRREVGETTSATSLKTSITRITLAVLALVVAAVVLPTDNPEAMQGFMYLGMLLAGYFLPWIIAASRHHHQSAAIFMLTLLLGWTVLGWIVAMVWACTAVRQA